MHRSERPRSVVDHYARDRAKAGRRGVFSRFWTSDDEVMTDNLLGAIIDVRVKMADYSDFTRWRDQFRRDEAETYANLAGNLFTISSVKKGLAELDRMNNRLHVFEWENAPYTREKFVKVIANESFFLKALDDHRLGMYLEKEAEVEIDEMRDGIRARMSALEDRQILLMNTFFESGKSKAPSRGDYNSLMRDIDSVSADVDALMAREKSLQEQYYSPSCAAP